MHLSSQKGPYRAVHSSVETLTHSSCQSLRCISPRGLTCYLTWKTLAHFFLSLQIDPSMLLLQRASVLASYPQSSRNLSIWPEYQIQSRRIVQSYMARHGQPFVCAWNRVKWGIGKNLETMQTSVCPTGLGRRGSLNVGELRSANVVYSEVNSSAFLLLNCSHHIVTWVQPPQMHRVLLGDLPTV